MGDLLDTEEEEEKEETEIEFQMVWSKISFTKIEEKLATAL